MRIQYTLTTTACTDTDKQKGGAAPLYQELWWVMLERNTQDVCFRQWVTKQKIDIPNRIISKTVEYQMYWHDDMCVLQLIGCEESNNPPNPTIASSSFDNGKAVNSWTLIGNRSAFLRPTKSTKLAQSWSQPIPTDGYGIHRNMPWSETWAFLPNYMHKQKAQVPIIPIPICNM